MGCISLRRVSYSTKFLYLWNKNELKSAKKQMEAHFFVLALQLILSVYLSRQVAYKILS